MLDFTDNALSAKRITLQERTLLVLALLFVALNRITLMLVQQRSWMSLWPLAIWIVCAVGMHLALDVTLPQRDPLILPVVMLLAGWGLTLVARLAPAFATRQAIWLIISAATGTLITTLPPNLRLLQRYRYTWLLVGIVLLAATLVFGVNPSGGETAPRLWLGFADAYFQPSEVLKILLVIFLASYLADKGDIISSSQIKLFRLRLPSLHYLAPLLLMWGFCIILLVMQRDLGAASLFFLIFLAMLYVATEDPSYPLIGLLMLIVAGAIGYRLFGVVRLRVDTWWNPWADPDNRAFQIVQSLLAVAAGGIFGQGVGQGAPTYIPVVHSDFVFAAIAEEWGLLGTIGAVLSIAVIVMRALHIALDNDRRPFRSLLAAGIGLMIGFQSLLIMGGVLKLVPLTGITLPFVSYGGSSLLSSFVMIGLLLRLSDPESQINSWPRRAAPVPELSS